MLQLHFKLKNTGSRAGEEIAEVYAEMPVAADEPPKRLVAGPRCCSRAEKKSLSPLRSEDRLAIWDEQRKHWTVLRAEYTLAAGGSSLSLPLRQTVTIR